MPTKKKISIDPIPPENPPITDEKDTAVEDDSLEKTDTAPAVKTKRRWTDARIAQFQNMVQRRKEQLVKINETKAERALIRKKQQMLNKQKMYQEKEAEYEKQINALRGGEVPAPEPVQAEAPVPVQAPPPKPKRVRQPRAPRPAQAEPQPFVDPQPAYFLAFC